MGLLSRLVVKSQSYSMDDFDRQVIERIRGGQVHSGINVSEESAMRYITVYSCVRVLAETIASLPLVVYKKRPNGGADKAPDHPVYDLLDVLPNDEMTTTTWREQQIGNLALSGNCYSIITTNRRGQPIDLYPIQWTNCRPFRDQSDGKIKYQVADRGKYEIFPADRVFHLVGFGSDGLVGYSHIQMAAESIGVGIAAAEFSARFYGQGMNIGGVLEHPGPNGLSDKAFERLREDLEARGAGLANSWRPLILEEGMKFNRIPMPLTDAQFIESRKFTRDEICGLFRMPPHMIANLERSTNNNIEQQSIEFVMYTLLPYVVKFEKTINWKLFTKAERAAGYYAKFNLSALLRGDYKSRQEGLAQMRQNGAINANEWRELEEMNPIEGPEGEAYLVNGTMTPTTVAANKTTNEGG
ncbi:phage portal protein [Paenibacillus sp. Pae108]|uniref:phage portal protein n=1 Tax=Paenibacillus sp. Pae108 TaxID=2926019 RepID=UPI0021178382|nr:phage portal protein [Paenibacillus sp. Pae108]